MKYTHYSSRWRLGVLAMASAVVSACSINAAASSAYRRLTIRCATSGFLLAAGLALTGLAGSFVGSADAQTSISVTNHSFEDGPSATGVPTGWTLTGGVATDLGVALGGLNGFKLLWIGPDTSIRQDLSYTLVEGETLTLQYDSSRGANYARKIQLYAKDGGTYQLLAETTEQTGDFLWPTIQLTYNVAVQYDGLTLALQIVGDDSGDADTDDWNEFDNFRITSDTVPPLQPYAQYRADQGITFDGTGHISNWATQTATGHDLDLMIGSPGTLTLSRSGGGTVSVVDLDGSSALWATNSNWGSLLGNRTVVARARLSGSSDGFLFDGSTGTGLTRAQVRGGNWQAGVQSTGDFGNADPDTTALTAQTWQTHIFQYEESGGNTVVTHWIDGTQVGSHSVSIDTGLGGLIVGAHGGSSAHLDVELAEILVYDGLLTSVERADIETELTTRWGDLIDLPFDYQSGTVVQNAGTVSSTGVQGIAALELTSVGNLVGDTVTSLTFNLNGTTDASDIDELQFYSSSSASFDAGSATLLGTAPAVAGTISINAPIMASKHYLWIAASLSGNSTNGDFLDAEITEFVLTGPSAGTHVPTVTAPPEFLTVGDTYFERTLFTSGATYDETVTMVSSPTSMTNYAGNVITLNGGATLTNQTTNTYRIPAIIMAANGDLVATCDARRDSSADLNGAQDIDIAVRRSTDNGLTWSDMEIMCDLGEGHPASDPSLVLDQVTGEIFCFYNYMDRSQSPNEYRLWVQSSTDHGQTWSIPRDITDDITLPAWKSDFKFMTSGRGYQTRSGRLLHNIVRVGSGVHLFASDDHGQTWFLLNETPVSPADESKVIELADGRLMINSRVNGGYGARHVHLSSDGGQTWTGYKDTQLVDPGCNGAIIRYTYAGDGYSTNRLLFSNANSSSGRVNLTLRVSYDEGVTWNAGKVMDPGASAYSDLTICQDGSIGILYEPGYSEVRFMGTTLEYVTDGADTLSKPYQLPGVMLTGDPYAWYRADVGVTTDGSNNVTNWATPTTTAWDLDNVIGTPKTSTVARSGGGTSTVVSLDGASALWAAADDFGSLTGDRTVVVRARLQGSSNGFLFDGSTTGGMTRAQIRNGMWQAGVQAPVTPPASNFGEPDPVTGSISPLLWQTHVFQYDESGGNTIVTHWIDGTQVGSHSVSVDTTLGGLMLGANGSGSTLLSVDLAEVIVYNRLLNTTERTDAEAWLNAQWGDLNIPLAYQSSTVVQTSSTIPKFGIHGVAALELTSSGTLSGNTVSSLTYNLSGTTDSADIEEVRLYDSGASSSFDSGVAELLATQSPPAGASGTFSIARPITAETQHLWIVVKLRGTSSNGDLIDCEITEFDLIGDDAGTYVPTTTAPAGLLTVDANAFYSMVLRKGGDDGSGNFRIPGLVTTNAGTIIASFDVRWDGNDISSPDLPADMDTAVMRSTDGGVTWGPMQIIMDYDENVAGSQGNGVGDPCLFVDRNNGRIWCASLWSKGNNGWTGSGPGLSADDTGQLVLSYSDDDGVTWTAPTSITAEVKDPAWNLYFQGPGKGICTREGTLVFPAQYKDGATPRSNFIYSTDQGATWVTAPAAIPSGNPWTTEAQIVELDSGDLLLSMRNHDGSKRRLWCVYSWNHATETIADGAWGAPWYEQTDPTVMGSVERYRSVVDGHPWSGLLFANPDSTIREKMSIRLSLDEGVTWPYKRKIDDLLAAYSCMTILPDGDIAILYETGEASSISRLVFARFPLTWLVGTTDTDLDGIPDFDEDVLGLNKNDITDGAKDSDGDGVSNFDEYKAQTDPLDKSSSLMANMESNGSGFKLTWPSVPYVNYRVETSTTLEGGSWAVVPGLENVQAQDTSIEVDLPVSAEPRNFYRVLIQ